MRAGRLDKAVSLLQPAGDGGDYGNPNPGYVVAVASVSAGVENLKGREYWEAQQANSEANMRVVMRWRDDVTADWRVGYEGGEYEITAPPVSDKRLDETILFCRLTT